MIRVRNLKKEFRVHRKEPGLIASIRSLFVREHIVKHALKGVSFEVGEGEILGLVGANGAGKTTLVKILSGIIHPSGGEVSVLDHDPWKREDDFRSRIALIMGQKAQLWWDLPAADCFLLLKEIYRIPDGQYRDTLANLCDMLKVSGEINFQIRRLSLGERMKMELIAALLHRPRVVFLDEPTIGLDLSAQRAIRDFLLQYREEHKPAMILTSHYMEDIERLCERILIIRDGEFVYDGALDRVVRHYANHKILTAHLKRWPEEERAAAVARLQGEVLEAGRDQVRVKVDREDVTRCAQQLLSEWPVVDLNIEEVDIGTVIERIFNEKGKVPA